MPIDLALRGVRKVFPNGTVAVDEFSLEVERGEFIALLGPSGCGKSTTLRMIGGFEDPSGGDVLIKGRRVNGQPPEQLSTNMIFQNYALFPHMNVLENVAYGLRVKGVDRARRQARAEEVLKRVGLHTHARRSIDQLSAGQRQRIAIARALAVDPDLLLLDEPLGALDANTRAYMQTELKLLQKGLGITFVFVTHSQAEAMAMADRIVVMNQGRVEQVGTPSEVYANPRTRFVAQFVGKNNLFPATVNGQAGTMVVRADAAMVAASHEAAAGEEVRQGLLVGADIVGSVITYSVQTGDGVLRAEQHERFSDQVPSLDSPVTMWWPAADAVFLTD
jgi:ABC-type Fe3+/spermidine/putrescine transport system ATPase subunit